jgi:hypothetical protein
MESSVVGSRIFSDMMSVSSMQLTGARRRKTASAAGTVLRGSAGSGGHDHPPHWPLYGPGQAADAGHKIVIPRHGRPIVGGFGVAGRPGIAADIADVPPANDAKLVETNSVPEVARCL